jgi:hypothetical protein
VSNYVYSNAGKIISSHDYSYGDWKPITPDTIIEYVYKTTYNAFKKSRKNLGKTIFQIKNADNYNVN